MLTLFRLNKRIEKKSSPMENTQVTQEVALSIELPTPESSTNSCTSNEEDLIQLMLAHNLLLERQFQDLKVTCCIFSLYFSRI